MKKLTLNFLTYFSRETRSIAFDMTKDKIREFVYLEDIFE